MKLINNLVCLIVLIFSLQSWTKASQLSLSKEAIKTIEGSYCGYLVYQSGAKFRIISTFRVNEQNNIWGNYIFENYDRDENKETFGDGEVYEGVFFNGKIENYEEKSKVFGLKVFWIDDFGDGYLQVIYVPRESFGGHWGSGKKVEGMWSGKKCDPETGETLKFK